MKLVKLVSTGVALLLIQACKHPIEIVGQGDVTSLSGNRGCTYEDATATPVPDNCAKNEVFWRVRNEANEWVRVDYKETYTAVPRDGWHFDSWVNCSSGGLGLSVESGNTCTFNVPSATVRSAGTATMPPLTAVFSPKPTVVPLPTSVPNPTAAPTAAPTPPIVSGDPCAGYKEKRVLMGAQSWWGAPGTEDSQRAHIHMETCFPLQQKISGVVPLDVSIKLHHSIGTEVTMFRVQMDGSGSASGSYEWKYENLVALNGGNKLICYEHDCKFEIRALVDTTKSPKDGTFQFRLTANTNDFFSFNSSGENIRTGERWFETTRWNATLANGKSVAGSSDPSKSPGIAGWTVGTEYINIYCGPGRGPAGTQNGYDFMTNVQKGIVKLGCDYNYPNSTAFASVDPDFHAHPANKGLIGLNDSSNGKKAITIDTTILSNGWHRLFLRSDHVRSDGVISSGNFTMMFNVQN